MITSLKLLRNVGQFDSVSAGANIPLGKLALIYAENGRGKTTLAAVFRSLVTGNPVPITERHRLSSEHPPHVVIGTSGSPPSIVFENGGWSSNVSNMSVYDDVFVDENICSGLEIEADHRQHLHEWILGAEGVALNRKVQDLVSKIETHIRTLRDKAAAIPVADRHGLSVDDFCALPQRPDIDSDIQEAERNLAAARDQESIQTMPIFETLNLPLIDLAGIEEVLSKDLESLDTTAVARVQSHLSSLGPEGETWVGQGMGFTSSARDGEESAKCPFCAQDLTNSPLIDHYRAYFSEEYANLKTTISDTLDEVNRIHSGEVVAAFERDVRVLGERKQFWGRFVTIPDLTIDTASIANDWKRAKEAVAAQITKKRSAPLEKMTLSEEARKAVADYENRRATVATVNELVQKANLEVPLVKEQAETGNPEAISTDLERLRAVKARHTPSIAGLCSDYISEALAKAQTEEQRDDARIELDNYRTSVFPGYQTAINEYLRRFNADFRINNVTSSNTRGGSACTYSVIINNTTVQVTRETRTQGNPSFRNTLSAGDRNTLALAFFFTSIDRDQDAATKVVVIDDPITSLDEHRTFTTVQEMRRLAQRVDQVIILSHKKPFLCHIWERTDSSLRSSMQLIRDNNGSTISAWDVEHDSFTEHDNRYAQLHSYLHSGADPTIDIAQAIRPVLENFLRVACPTECPPGRLLGPFLQQCHQKLGTAQQILDSSVIQELEDLKEYANRFQHDTNPAWQTETINDGELRGFVQRTLDFIRPHA